MLVHAIKPNVQRCTVCMITEKVTVVVLVVCRMNHQHVYSEGENDVTPGIISLS